MEITIHYQVTLKIVITTIPALEIEASASSHDMNEVHAVYLITSATQKTMSKKDEITERILKRSSVRSIGTVDKQP